MREELAVKEGVTRKEFQRAQWIGSRKWKEMGDRIRKADGQTE